MELYMNKSIKLGLFALLWATTLSMFAPGEEEAHSEQQQRSQQQDTILRQNTFFHQHELQNLDELRHTHQKYDEKGLSAWTSVKTWWSHRTLGGLKEKGAHAIVEDAFKFNENEPGFKLNDKQKAAFKSLSAQEQLEFINEYQKHIIIKHNYKIDRINADITARTQELKEALQGTLLKKGLNQEISELEQELQRLETSQSDQYLRGSTSTLKKEEIKNLKEQIATKQARKAKLTNNHTSFDAKQKTEINRLNAFYDNKIVALAHQINPLLHSSIYLRFNEASQKFEFHKTNESPIYKKFNTPTKESVLQQQRLEKRNKELGQEIFNTTQTWESEPNPPAAPAAAAAASPDEALLAQRSEEKNREINRELGVLARQTTYGGPTPELRHFDSGSAVTGTVVSAPPAGYTAPAAAAAAVASSTVSRVHDQPVSAVVASPEDRQSPVDALAAAPASPDESRTYRGTSDFGNPNAPIDRGLVWTRQ
jgi:hypothetical protein